MPPELQRSTGEDGTDEQQHSEQQVDLNKQVVEIKLTAQHCTLIVAILHWIISEHSDFDGPSMDLDWETLEELRALAMFFAAVSLEPWKFPPRMTPPATDIDRWEGEGGA